ncbi:hypothetical protein [Microbacterium sp. P04]|uniref:hypothetical protein n=1 Tax=Microbacterium sp. P04 TaxID=3366947 RepID=UPI003745097C
MHTFGHEVVAEVTRTWGNTTIQEGSRFVLDPHAPVDRTSGLATDIVLWGTEANLARAVRSVDASAPPDLAVFIEPLACAISCVETALRLATRAARRVLIAGAGVYGAIIATLLARAGYDVTITNRTDARLIWLRSRLSQEYPSVRFVVFDDLVPGSFDLIIDAAAEVDPLIYDRLASLLVSEGQLHIFAGTRPDRSRALGVDLDEVRRNALRVSADTRLIKITGSHGAVSEHFERATTTLADATNPLDLRFLTRKRIGLHALPIEFDRMSKRAAFGKVLVDPTLPGQGDQLALVRRGSRFVIQTTPDQATSVLFEPLLVGLCGTDMQMISGERTSSTDILGHEVVGRVLVSDVPHLRQGQLAVINPLREFDPSQVIGHSAPGALRSRLSPEHIELRDNVLIPYDGPLSVGALVEPTACVYHGIRAASLDSVVPKRVAVIGDGALAVIAALVITTHGHQVDVFVKHRQRVEPLRRLVATRNVEVRVFGYSNTLQGAFDTVFNCTTRKAALAVLQYSAFLLRPDGCLNMVSGVTDEDALSNPQLRDAMEVRASNVGGQENSNRVWMTVTDERMQVTGHRGAGLKDFEASQAAINNSYRLYEQLIGRTMDLSEAAAFLERLARGGRRDNEARTQKNVILMPGLSAVAPSLARWRPQQTSVWRSSLGE